MPPKLAMVAVTSNDMIARREGRLYAKTRRCEDEKERECHVGRVIVRLMGALTRDDIEAGGCLAHSGAWIRH